MKNTFEDLKNHLFVALEKLGDDHNPVDLDRIKSTVEVSKVLIEAAKVEVNFLNLIGKDTSIPFFKSITTGNE